jgi:polyisoprenoid-binding protein YceI
MMKLFLISFLAVFASTHAKAQLYSIESGYVHFASEAPLELIQAESNELKGLIDFEKQTFAFSISVSSFKGFNSALQREHFNENYMESEKFPKATFSGRIIEKVNVLENGEFKIRAKGKFVIHGVEQERIIQSTVTSKGGFVTVVSEFTVALQDHNISVPKVVQHKIAEVITVRMNANAVRK